MKSISVPEKNKLFKQIKVSLGAPVRDLEVDNDVLETLLEIAIEDYSGHINDWLIHQQWGTLHNQAVEKTDIIFALTTKSLDFEKSFTYAYSKQAGVGTNSPWELKKDYITISADTQVYSIPANREVNEVLWYTPPQVNTLGFDSMVDNGWSFGAYGWNHNGVQTQAVLPAYNITLFTQDIKMKKHILQSQLTYKITGGPNGTKNLHLYPIPGSRDEIRGRWGRREEGAKVWYWYYDVNNDERDKCLEENSDIIKLPSDVPIKSLDWGDLNEPSRRRVRNLLIARTKKYIGLNRGKFSGEIKGRDGANINMDYNMFLSQSETEESKVFEDLDEFLQKITYRSLIEEKAEISENINRIMENTPSHHRIIQF